MSRRPSATVRVLKVPHLHPDAIRVEVDCRHGTTGLTQIPAPDGPELPTPALITAACFEHEARCGDCDTAEAHAQGAQALRAWTEDAWARLTAESVRRHFHGRRN